MQFERIGIRSSIDRPTLCFLIGLALTMLALWFPFIPGWQTFIHMWRVEIAASLLLLGALAFVLTRSAELTPRIAFTKSELSLIVLPMLALIAWSGLSAIWAPSWKSAIHHTLIWTEYLVFYLIFRQMLEKKQTLRPLLFVFVACLALYALPAIFEYCAFLTFGGTTTIGTRFAKYGEQIVTIAPLVTLGVVRTRGRAFAIGATAVVVMWLLIFCSFGRVNYLLFAGVMIGLFVAVLLSKQYRPYAPRYLLLAAILIVAPFPLHVFSLFSTSAAVPVLSRATDSTSYNSSNGFRKLMISVSAEMIREHPITGIGADNFGQQVNIYRQRYGAVNPDDPNLANAEDQIPSHAHNEFLQIAAELGAVGIAITCWLMLGIGVLAYRAAGQLRSGSLYPVASVIGLAAFLASSLVSAYSFRVMQNGILFFFVLALASKMLFHRSGEPAKETDILVINRARLKFAGGFAIVACVALIVYSGVRVTSSAITARANNTRYIADAAPLYELAMRLDDENPDASRDYGMRLFRRQRYAEAVPYLSSAISLGRGPSADLSYLASARSLSGDEFAAEETLRTASQLYPRSPFVLTRYATFLENRGKLDVAAPLLERATTIDKRATDTWRAVIMLGPKRQSELTARDYSSYMHISELMPQSSLYAVVTERYIKFPDERRFSLLKVVDDEE